MCKKNIEHKCDKCWAPLTYKSFPTKLVCNKFFQAKGKMKGKERDSGKKKARGNENEWRNRRRA